MRTHGNLRSLSYKYVVLVRLLEAGHDLEELNLLLHEQVRERCQPLAAGADRRVLLLHERLHGDGLD